MAGKAGKVWSLPRFWVSIRSYKKQPVKKIWGRILDLAWLKFAVAALTSNKASDFLEREFQIPLKNETMSWKLLIKYKHDLK